MKAVKKVEWKGSMATLFANGTIVWAGMMFENGLGANAGLIKALSI